MAASFPLAFTLVEGKGHRRRMMLDVIAALVPMQRSGQSFRTRRAGVQINGVHRRSPSLLAAETMASTQWAARSSMEALIGTHVWR